MHAEDKTGNAHGNEDSVASLLAQPSTYFSQETLIARLLWTMADENNNTHDQGQPVANSSAKRAPPTNDAEERLAIERELAAKLRGTRDYLSSISTEAASTPSSSEQQQEIHSTNIQHETATTATDSGDTSSSRAPPAEPTDQNGAYDEASTSMALPDTSSSLAQGNPVMLDGGQNAEEQQLEPDVRFVLLPIQC